MKLYCRLVGASTLAINLFYGGFVIAILRGWL